MDDSPHPPRSSSIGWHKSHAVKSSTSKISTASSIGTFVTAPDSQNLQGAATSSDAADGPVTSSKPFEDDAEAELDPTFESAPPVVANDLYTHFEADRESQTELVTPSVQFEDPVTPDNASERSTVTTLRDSFDADLSLNSDDLAFFPTPPKGYEKGYLMPRTLSTNEKRVWKDMTDEIVKGYLKENFTFADKLDKLKDKAEEATAEDYEKSCAEMLASTMKNRLRIMGAGDSIHRYV